MRIAEDSSEVHEPRNSNAMCSPFEATNMGIVYYPATDDTMILMRTMFLVIYGTCWHVLLVDTFLPGFLSLVVFNLKVLVRVGRGSVC